MCGIVFEPQRIGNGGGLVLDFHNKTTQAKEFNQYQIYITLLVGGKIILFSNVKKVCGGFVRTNVQRLIKTFNNALIIYSVSGVYELDFLCVKLLYRVV